MAASLYSFQASAFLAILSASALALASIANASASPRRISASASAYGLKNASLLAKSMQYKQFKKKVRVFWQYKCDKL